MKERKPRYEIDRGAYRRFHPRTAVSDFEVLDLLNEGKKPQDIADLLFMSNPAVYRAITRIKSFNNASNQKLDSYSIKEPLVHSALTWARLPLKRSSERRLFYLLLLEYQNGNIIVEKDKVHKHLPGFSNGYQRKRAIQGLEAMVVSDVNYWDKPVKLIEKIEYTNCRYKVTWSEEGLVYVDPFVSLLKMLDGSIRV